MKGKIALAILVLLIGGITFAQAVNVILTWTASTTTGVSTNIYQETAAGTCVSGTPANGTTCKKLANVVNGTSTYTDTTPAVGSKYWYVARALNVSGIESNNSNEVVLDLTQPNPPTVLACTVTLAGSTVTIVCK